MRPGSTASDGDDAFMGIPDRTSPGRRSRGRAVADAPRQPVAEALGRLLLVVDAHDGGTGLIVSAVRRRCADVPDLIFARRLTTRPDGPHDAESAVSRRAFRDAEQAGEFLVTWDLRGHRFGLPATLRDVLAAGRTVVAAAPAGIVPDIRALWADVRIIRIMAEIDAVRSPLEPRLCLARMLGAKWASRKPIRRGLSVDASITCANDPPEAVRLLTEALMRLRADGPTAPLRPGSSVARTEKPDRSRRSPPPAARA